MTKAEFVRDTKRFKRGKLRVEIEPDTYHPGEYILATTHDGACWSTIGLGPDEMRQVAEEILRYLREEVD